MYKECNLKKLFLGRFVNNKNIFVVFLSNVLGTCKNKLQIQYEGTASP